jgi:hypothetical protein
MEKDKVLTPSMQFLGDYGLAILAAIIAIGVLAYFGVFAQSNPEVQDCLKEIASPLCQERNLTLYNDGLNLHNDFKCIGEHSGEERNLSLVLTISFTQDEIMGCANEIAENP